MKTGRSIHLAVLAAVAAWGFAGSALADDEQADPHNSIGTAQLLTIGSDGSVTVNANMGLGDGDTYAFDAKAGDVVTVDIDGGSKPAGTPGDVDLFVSMLDATDQHRVLRDNDDSLLPEPDPGSFNTFDPYLQNVVIPADGRYYVVVSALPNMAVDGGGLTPGTASNPTGSYTVIISGVTPPLAPPPPPQVETQQIIIDIEPGRRRIALIDPKSRHSIPVVLMSSLQFDPMNVDLTSLTFGSTGDEESLKGCSKLGVDFNHDGKRDLVCQFANDKAGFYVSDREGIVKGRTKDGVDFEGRGALKVISLKARWYKDAWGRWYRRHGDDRDDDRRGHNDPHRGWR
ncbi:MAG: PPC domain-containing protein [Burkholderiales bacterium]